MESNGARTEIGHKVVLWGMILPTALATGPHLFPIPWMLYLGTMTAGKFAVLVFFYSIIAVAWKLIMAFDRPQSWSRKGMIVAGWAVMFISLMKSPCIGKSFFSFIQRT